MSTAAIIAIVIIVGLVMLAIAAWAWSKRNRSQHLRERFGGEYERSVRVEGRSAAERELSEREKRVEKLRLKDLTSQQRDSFAEEWRSVQARFVDNPNEAILQADSLVQRVMDARGYPLDGFERQKADISVDHPDVVRNYEAGHGIAEEQRKGNASTEDLRQGMIHYRALFNELLGAPVTA